MAMRKNGKSLIAAEWFARTNGLDWPEDDDMLIIERCESFEFMIDDAMYIFATMDGYIKYGRWSEDEMWFVSPDNSGCPHTSVAWYCPAEFRSPDTRLFAMEKEIDRMRCLLDRRGIGDTV